MGLFLSQHVAPVWLDIFLCHAIKRNNRSRSFSFLFLQQFNSMLPTNSTNFDTSSRFTLAKVACLEFIMFLFFLTRGILGIHPWPGNPPPWTVFHLHRAPRGAPIGQVSSPMGREGRGGEPDRCSEFSLDLRAHCSAILVSELLRIVDNIGFCWRHFFAYVEIEDVVPDVDWNELSSSVPTHQSVEVRHHVRTNFAVYWNHETIIGRALCNVVSLSTANVNFDTKKTVQIFEKRSKKKEKKKQFLHKQFF